MQTVSFELIRQIREHINRIEKQSALLNNRGKWLRLTSALDVLEDTANVVDYYLNADYPSDIRGKYLFTYGLIQALFVQQDAANSICVALFDKEIDFKEEYPDAYLIREMRNDVIGHPTNRCKSQFIYLIQVSLNKGSFEYIKEDVAHETPDIIKVSIQKAIGDVAICVNDILETTINKLNNEFRNYIDMHKERKMREIFQRLLYAKEKVLLNDPHLSDWGYDATKRMVNKCKEELLLRYGSIDAIESYKYLIESIQEIYTLVDIELHRIPSDIQPQIKKCLLENLFTKLKELENLCEETDYYFENYGSDN